MHGTGWADEWMPMSEAQAPSIRDEGFLGESNGTRKTPFCIGGGDASSTTDASRDDGTLRCATGRSGRREDDSSHHQNTSAGPATARMLDGWARAGKERRVPRGFSTIRSRFRWPPRAAC